MTKKQVIIYKYIETCKILRKVLVKEFSPEIVNIKITKDFNIETDDTFMIKDFIEFLENKKVLDSHMNKIFDYLLSSKIYEKVEHKEQLYFNKNMMLKFLNSLKECLKRGLEEREDD